MNLQCIAKVVSHRDILLYTGNKKRNTLVQGKSMSISDSSIHKLYRLIKIHYAMVYSYEHQKQQNTFWERMLSLSWVFSMLLAMQLFHLLDRDIRSWSLCDKNTLSSYVQSWCHNQEFYTREKFERKTHNACFLMSIFLLILIQTNLQKNLLFVNQYKLLGREI